MPVLEAPVQVGKCYDVTIEAAASKDEGLATYKGFLIFVKDAKPGEKLKVEITEITKRFAYAKKV